MSDYAQFAQANPGTDYPVKDAALRAQLTLDTDKVDAAALGYAFGYNRGGSAALNFAYYGGQLNVAGVLTTIAGGTVALTNSTTNYVEMTTAGVVSNNTVGFTAGRIRLYTVVTAGGAITVVTDKRGKAMQGGDASFAALAVSGAQTIGGTLGVTGRATFSGSVDLAQATDFNLLGSSGTNFARMNFSSAGNTLLTIDNATDLAAAEIRLRTRTLGSTVNVLTLTSTAATVPGSLSVATTLGVGGVASLTGATPGLYFSGTSKDTWRITEESSSVLQILNNDSGSGAVLQFARTGEMIKVGDSTTARIVPSTDTVGYIGEAGRRWNTIYASSGAINTSDAREKTKVTPLSPQELAAAKDLAREVGYFQFLSALAEKGERARKHIGMTVQRAIAIMEAHGLDPMGYGFICYDQWEDKAFFNDEESHEEETGVLNAKGEKMMRVVVDKEAFLDVHVKAGDRYSFRPDELLMFIARGIEQRLTDLEGG